jgi:GDP-mannose 6-dehydrogenase
VIERLIGKGYDLRRYDKNVVRASLTGANKSYILNVIPHISQLMVATLEDALAHGETIVNGNGTEKFRNMLSRTKDNQVIVDLVRIGNHRSIEGRYDGICW